MTDTTQEMIDYFTTLYGDDFRGYLWVGSFLKEKKGAREGKFVSTPLEAALHAASIDKPHYSGVYHSSTIYDPERIDARIAKEGPYVRGGEAEVSRMVAAFYDLDTQDGVHKTEKRLPATLEQGMEIIRTVMPPETMITFSGGGYYPIWKLSEELTFTNAQEVREVKMRYRDLSLEVIRAFSDAGMHLDSTFDLARVYRVPGTTNYKQEGMPAQARVVSSGGPSAPASMLRRSSAPASVTPEFLAPLELMTSSEVEHKARAAAKHEKKNTPWSKAAAELEVERQLEVIRTASSGINTRWGGAALWIGRFVPALLSAEEAMSRMMAAASLNETHSDQWNLENGYNWTAESLLQQCMSKGEGSFTVHAEQSPTLANTPAAATDAVEALLAEMLDPEQVIERPPPRPLIKGLLNMDSESWIIGEPGSKKSFVALDFAGHVTNEMPWRGRRVTGGLVVMIVAEGVGGFGSRLKAWEQRYARPAKGMHGLKILPRPVQAKDLQAWKVLVEACRRLRPALVVIDTQARVTVGLEENSATDMGVYVEAARAIREATEACVLTVHHTGRNGGDARGSSAIDGAQYTELKVITKGALEGVLATEKQKDMEMAPDIPLRFTVMNVGMDDEGEPMTSLALTDDAYAEASAEVQPADLSEVSLLEPQDWTVEFVPARNSLQRRILQVMWQTGGTVGRTQAEYKKVTAERWYPGAKKLAEKDWGAAWTAVVGLEVPHLEFEDEDVAVVERRGGKFYIRPEVMPGEVTRD